MAQRGDTCGVESDSGARPFMLVPVGDSSESRLFIELSSFGADLAEARDALDLAARADKLSVPERHLVGMAVIAYCRTILHSNVRGRITDHVPVPQGLIHVNDLVRSYRNATVAHSQSELAVTYAVGVLDSDTLEVRDVAGPTVVVPLPANVVLEFRDLIDHMEMGLDDVLAPIRANLVAALEEADPQELWAATQPVVQEKWAHEFNPRTTRAPYPTGHTVYWDRNIETRQDPGGDPT